FQSGSITLYRGCCARFQFDCVCYWEDDENGLRRFPQGFLDRRRGDTPRNSFLRLAPKRRRAYVRYLDNAPRAARPTRWRNGASYGPDVRLVVLVVPDRSSVNRRWNRHYVYCVPSAAERRLGARISRVGCAGLMHPLPNVCRDNRFDSSARILLQVRA